MATIRPAHIADADRIHRIHTASIRALARSAYSSDLIESWAGHLRPALYLTPIHEGRLWVVEAQGALVALGILDEDHSEVKALYVAPDHARCGHGRRLLRHLEAEIQRAGHVQSQLSASKNAIAFYERMGYRVVGRAEHCLPNGGRLACADMQRGLPTGPRLAGREEDGK